MDNSELYHHGVKGMRWGVRRSQVQLGHRPSSNKKFSFRSKNSKDLKKKKSTSTDTKPEEKKKTIKDMSDEELRSKISRLELERRYSDLSKSNSPQQINKGRDFVMDVLERSGKNIATQAVTYAMGAGVNKFARDVLNVKNGTKTIKDNDGAERVIEIFEDIVNPRKGQKDK